jgi:hypothetical protein
VLQPGCLDTVAVVRAINPVQGGEVGSKKGIAARRSHGCFGIVTSDRHEGQNTPIWLKTS